MKYTTLTLVASIAVLASACSALINPDDTRLGDRDGGPGSDARMIDAPPPADGGGVDGNTPDAPVVCTTDCNDDIDCTTDSCVDGSCQNLPDDGVCGDRMRCSPLMGCIPLLCTDHDTCDDALYCTGVETCDPDSDAADPATGCIPGEMVECGDDITCTADSCDEDADSCVFIPDSAVCDDGVHCTVDTCDTTDGCVSMPNDALCMDDFCVIDAMCGTDGCVGGARRTCDDMSACTMDSCDEDADSCVNTLRDTDMDGYGIARAGGMMCAGGTDCDDTDATVNPGAMEACNGVDDNCDGRTDEGCPDAPDTCSTAYEIPLRALGGPSSARGTLGTLGDHYRSQCSGTGGRDAVYYVDVTATMDLEIDTIGSAADTVIAVAETCTNTGFGLACEDDIDSGMVFAGRIWVHRFGPSAGMLSRRLFILVDGYDSGETGDYVVNVRASAARGDTCATPIDISGGGSMVGWLTPSPIGFGQVGTCQPPGSAADIEAIAELSGPSDSSVRLDAYSNDFQPDVYMRHFTCTGTEVACQVGGGGASMGYMWHTEVTEPTTVDRPYFVFVDGATTSSQYWLAYEP